MRASLAVTARLPEPAERGLVAGLAGVAHGWLGIRRELAEENLRRAFPERPAEWIRATARAAYAHLGREMLVAARLERLGREGVLARTRVEGLDGLREALGRGRGAVLFTGHFGNWELAGAALTVRGVPLDVVAQRQSNRHLDALIRRAREAVGMRVIERGKAPRGALRALRSGRAVGFVADQDARRHGVFVPFFGRPASTHRGPALLALRASAPVFVVTAARVPDGYEVTVEPVVVDRGGETEQAIERLTAAATARLEAAVRRHPEQYLWLHRRWRTRPRPAPAQEPPSSEPV